MGQWRRFRSLLMFALLIAVVNQCFAKHANSTSNRRGKALNISKKSCSDPTGRKGTCTFKWDCINQNGTKIGTCMDGFIVGTCCYYEIDPYLYVGVTENGMNDMDQNDQQNYLKPYKNSQHRPFQKTTTKTPIYTSTKAQTTVRPKSTTASNVPTVNQLVTWTSFSPTKISNHKQYVLSPFPFPQKVSYPQFPGRWPFGMVFAVDPYRPKRPLHQFQPSIFQDTNKPKQPPSKVSSPTSNGNFTIFGSNSNKINDSLATQTVEMTTLSVPIPEWTSTITSGNLLPPIVNSVNRLPLTSARPYTSNNSFTTYNKQYSGAVSLSTTRSTTSTSTTSKPQSVTQPQKKKPLLDYRKDCGVRALTPKARIVGGMSTHFGKWPWQILVKEAAWLGLYHKNKCGGVLISSKYAITAGHCQPGFLSSLVVLLGEYDLTNDFETLKPEMRRVKRMVVHRHYNPQNFDNDIALLELDPPVIFKPHLSPICLPEKDEEFTGRMAYVTGWGKTMHGGSIPNLLQEVQVPIVSNGKCLEMFKLAGHTKVIKDNFLCAGYESGGKDSCEGDSGGPLMTQRADGRWVLVGTVSHGIRCADPNLPGVYMRISAYKNWIEKIIGTI